MALVPMLVALYGFGFAFAAIVLLLKEANTLIDTSNYMISMLSGSQFPVSVLPRFLLPLSLAIPLTYGFDAVRGHLLERVGRREAALSHYRRAAEGTASLPERNYLLTRAARLSASMEP